MVFIYCITVNSNNWLVYYRLVLYLLITMLYLYTAIHLTFVNESAKIDHLSTKIANFFVCSIVT